MDYLAAALMQRPAQVAAAFEFLAFRWPFWRQMAEHGNHVEGISRDWPELVGRLGGDEDLAANCLAVSAVAGLLQDDGVLLDEDVHEATIRLQMACDADCAPNFQGHFEFTAELFELAAPEV